MLFRRLTGIDAAFTVYRFSAACQAARRALYCATVSLFRLTGRGPGLVTRVAVTSAGLFRSAAIPAGLGTPVIGPAPLVPITAPAIPVLSLDEMVLLMMEVLTASKREIPPPAQPATLFTTML